MSYHTTEELKYDEDVVGSTDGGFETALVAFVSGVEAVLTGEVMAAFNAFQRDPLRGKVLSRVILETHSSYPIYLTSGLLTYMSYLRAEYIKLDPIVVVLAGSILAHRAENSLLAIQASEAKMIAAARALFFRRESLKYLFRYIVDRTVKLQGGGQESAKGMDCLINETALLHLIELVLQEILTNRKRYRHDELSDSEPDSPVAQEAKDQLLRLDEMQRSLDNLRLLNLFCYSHNLAKDSSKLSQLLSRAVSDFVKTPTVALFMAMKSAYVDRISDLEDKAESIQALNERLGRVTDEMDAVSGKISKMTGDRDTATEVATQTENYLRLCNEQEELQKQISAIEQQLENLELEIIKVSSNVFSMLNHSGLIIFEVLSGSVDQELAKLLNNFLCLLMERPSVKLPYVREWYFASMYALLVSRDVKSTEFKQAIDYLQDIVLMTSGSRMRVNPGHRTKSCRRGAATAFLRLVIDLKDKVGLSDSLVIACINLLVEHSNIKFSIIGATVTKELQAVLGAEKFDQLWGTSNRSHQSFDDFLREVECHASCVPVTGVRDVFAHPVADFLMAHSPPTSSPVLSLSPDVPVSLLALPPEASGVGGTYQPPVFRDGGVYAAEDALLIYTGSTHSSTASLVSASA